MADQPQPLPQGSEMLPRRRVLAGGAAIAGAAIAALAKTDGARAAHDTAVAYDTQTAMHVDVTNTTSGSTRISSNISGTAAFVALNNYPVGISRPDGILGRTTYTTSNCAGVAGSCEAASGGLGVLGTTNNQTGTGVFGFAGSSVPFIPPPGGTGVFGQGPNRGVMGSCVAGVGVRGESDTGAGMQGVSDTASGVEGTSTSGAGMKAASTSGAGLQATTDTGTAVEATAGATGVAGRFKGKVVVEGALEAAGVSASGSAALAGPVSMQSSLAVTGPTTLGGLTVNGPTTFGGPTNLNGPVSLGAAATLDRLALPKTSGVVTLGRSATSAVVTGLPVSAASLVVATLQNHRKGLFVEAAVPVARSGAIRIHFNKRARRGTKVAWMLVN